MLSFPILSLAYIFIPSKRIVNFLRVPYIKFLIHTASALAFGLLIFLSLMRIEDWIATGRSVDSTESLQNTIISDSRRGHPPTVIEMIMFAWIVGMTWREIKEIWSHGAADFTVDSWNIMDFIQLSLYWMSYALILISWITWRTTYSHLSETGELQRSKRQTGDELEVYMTTNVVSDLQSYIDIAVQNITSHTVDVHRSQLDLFINTLVNNFSCLACANDGNHETENGIQDFLEEFTQGNYVIESRLLWDAFDPELVSEGIFALANIISFLRLINIVIVSKQVGPLQISLWGMVNDILKFLAIFCFVLIAFAVGLTQLYKFYSALSVLECRSADDSEPGCYDGFTSFGTTVKILFWNLFGYINLNVIGVEANHVFTEGVGEFSYAAYHVIGVLILLNALIAMMSNTYSRIEENRDTEWKYSRAKLWLSYLDSGGTIPPPFNIIPSVKSIYYALNWLKYFLCPRLQGKKIKKQWDKIGKLQQDYEDVVQQLVLRYWAEKRSGGHEGDKFVTQADILKLKQDMSGLKYEILSQIQRSDKTLGAVKGTTSGIMQRVTDMESALMESTREDSEWFKKVQDELLRNSERNERRVKDTEDEYQAESTLSILQMRKRLAQDQEATSGAVDSPTKQGMCSISVQTDGQPITEELRQTTAASAYEEKEESIWFDDENEAEMPESEDFTQAGSSQQSSAYGLGVGFEDDNGQQCGNESRHRAVTLHKVTLPPMSSDTETTSISDNETSTSTVSPMYELFDQLTKT
ncbi:short transient receptor potential channel 4-like [Ptychodera flava]|uniref:short transient receptor potential channel 4-like n=1 Tax=Ptychodera flava TaxID=63121 RepID=UPI00396A8E81